MRPATALLVAMFFASGCVQSLDDEIRSEVQRFASELVECMEDDRDFLIAAFQDGRMRPRFLNETMCRRDLGFPDPNLSDFALASVRAEISGARAFANLEYRPPAPSEPGFRASRAVDMMIEVAERLAETGRW